MLVLQGSQDLHILFESLEESIPETQKVYGAIFNIKNKNPFNMEVLVDAWPDYQVVITRPKKEEMKDDLDHYTNTYHIFTKDLDKLEEVLRCPQVINWEQVFQIQGCQENLDKAIRNVSASKLVQVEYTKTMLFVPKLSTKHKTSSNDSMEQMDLFKMDKPDENSKKIKFQSIFLDSSHAELVNEQWSFGKNEKSLKYIQRCLQNFPGYSVLGPEGTPISWVVMEQSCELRMGYTVPRYRGQGYMRQISSHFGKFLIQKNIPFYLHVAHDNESTKNITKNLELKVCPCGWHQWICTPQKYC
ncbi:glycine N-acyltransferase-like protein 2 [Orycteropus afer afer]|uniref:Glycine N-acyltransferase-like protein n=1 Tax=Orycteropus afer afer TaxID=1230840 RepID=A0A8B7AVQ4_ORYAF|nr:glycine N-acyltransferase-like protein 2 [Orycteropus afer afer]